MSLQNKCEINLSPTDMCLGGEHVSGEHSQQSSPNVTSALTLSKIKIAAPRLDCNSHTFRSLVKKYGLQNGVAPFLHGSSLSYGSGDVFAETIRSRKVERIAHGGGGGGEKTSGGSI